MTLDWESKYAPMRNPALALKKAIEGTADALFDGNVPNPILFKEGWKNVHTIFWPVNCKLMEICPDSKIGRTRNLRDRFFFRARRVREFGLDAPGQWETDSLDLEALLSIWVWSLRSSLQSTKVSENLSMAEHDPEDLPCYRIISAGARGQETYLNLMVWFDGHAKTLGHRAFRCETKHFEPMVGHTVDYDFHREPCWIFRNNCLDDWTPKYEDNLEIVIFCSSQENVTLVCAQQIYTAFFRAMLQIVEDIGGDTAQDSDHALFLTNTNIDRIRDAFVQSGIGGRQDADNCIIPALYSHKLLPSRKILNTVGHFVERHRTDGNLTEVSTNLNWVYNQSLRFVQQDHAQWSTDSESPTAHFISTGENFPTNIGDSDSSGVSIDDRNSAMMELRRSVESLCEYFVHEVSSKEYFPEVFYQIQEMLEDNIDLPQNWDTIAECASKCLRIFKERQISCPQKAMDCMEVIERILNRKERRIEDSEILVRGWDWMEYKEPKRRPKRGTA
ncbi:hypothetical protein IWZ01DRAFT_523990 [Phyllosticta capitalensis]